MFILDGKPLPMDRAFTTSDGCQYPRNWLRLSTIEEKQAIGITEVPDNEPSYDQRFYWGPNNPKDHTQLVEQWVNTVKQTAGTLLQNTDWVVIRSQDLSSQKPIPDEVLNERGLIRFKSDEKEARIKATTSTEELASYVTSAEFNSWENTTPESPSVSAESPLEDSTSSVDIGLDTITFTGGTTSSRETFDTVTF